MNKRNIGIFVVDDSRDDLDLIKAAIENDGTIGECNFFTDEQVYLKGDLDDMHVCVLDHHLGHGAIGFDVLKVIKQRNKGTFIIILSGTDDKKAIIAYNNAGAERYVDKNERDYLATLMIYIKEGVQITEDRVEFIEYLKREQNRDRSSV